MRIYNSSEDKVLRKVMLYLTPSEIEELMDYLTELKENPEIQHNRFMEFNKDFDVLHEIVIAVYTDENLHSFDDRSKKIILENK